MARRNLLSLFLTLLVACRQSNRLTGSFAADGRPSWLGFLTMTQTDKRVSGYITFTTPDDRGGTESRTTAVEGTTDGDAVTLHLKSFLNLGNVTFVGRLSGDALQLSVPSKTGKVESATFIRGTQEGFNAALAVWQTTLRAAYEKRRGEEADATARQQQADAVAADRASRQRAAMGAREELTSNARSLVLADQHLSEQASFSRQLASYDRMFKQMERRAEALRNRIDRGRELCWVLKSALGAVKTDLVFVKGQGQFLEQRARQVDQMIANLERRSPDLEQRIGFFLRAVEADPTGSVPPAEAKNLTEASRQLIAMASTTTANARKVVEDGRKAGRAFDERGEALLQETSRLVASAPCRER